MNLDALFSDGTAEYVLPMEPDENQRIRIRFRTAKDDVDTVLLMVEEQSHEMHKLFTKGFFDYYEIDWTLGTEVFSYYFSVVKNEKCYYYNRLGVIEHLNDYYKFRIVPGFSTPDWAKGAVTYQIFVDRFYNGDPGNDVVNGEYIYIDKPSEKVENWDEPPAYMDVHRFYGGDIQGVLDKLDYLEDLGVEVVYFNPLFVSPSNHKYDIQDYDNIDPHYGVIVKDGGETVAAGAYGNITATKYQKRTGDHANLSASNALFVKLIEEMHKRGMRVIIDGVFNHCGSFNKWMDRERIYEQQEQYKKGAYVSADSEYRHFFRFFKEEETDWPYNENYDGWWGHSTLPKLNYEDSACLRKYIFHIARKWVSPPYNADGWRLDVAADLGYSNDYNHQFWKWFRQEVKSANPKALILAEHYGDPGEWLLGDEWDTVMNYDAFMEPISWFLTGMEKHSDERRGDLQNNADIFVKSICHHMAAMLPASLQVAMNELSNHDHSRFLTRTNHKVGRVDYWGHKAAEENVNLAVMREAVVFQFTWVGAPTIYYGDEAGLCGFTDPDNRRTYPWGKENHDLIAFHKAMIQIQKESSVLRTGSLRVLTWEDGMFSYARFNEDEQILVALNNTTEVKQLTIPAWIAELPATGLMKRVMYTYESGYTTDLDKVYIQDGEVVVNMGAYSAIVLKPAKEDAFQQGFW
ncbi:MAG: glycoside hydrolase family 13 protein [Lachnospiraceae bacterium]|nr:glycoside hydrolase family 13 protein [Lachnospiraceae bacterium]